MEFWGVEVGCGRTAVVFPECGTVIHIKQVSLGAVKKEDLSETIHLHLKIDGLTTSLGTISCEGFPQLPSDLSYDRIFELSHDWKYGAVYFLGCCEDKPYEMSSPFTDSFGVYPCSTESELNEDVDMGSEVVKVKSDVEGSAGKPKSSAKRKDVDDSSDVKDFKHTLEDDEETPKVESGKKGHSESATKALASVNSAELAESHNTALYDPTYPNKRPRLIDDPRLWFYENTLALANSIISLKERKTRVENMLSEMADPSRILRQFDAEFEELLTSIRMPTDEVSAEQGDRSLKLIQLVLEGWESVKVQSAWLLISDWHGQAYEELRSIRNNHSYLLDHAYEKKCEGYKSNKVSGPVLLMYKKCLNFLVSSRDDISSLPKAKCFGRVMRIRRFLTEEKYMTSRNQHANLQESTASCSFRNVIPSNWRDQLYDRIISLRKEHSYKLDEAYNFVHEMRFWSVKLDKDVDECLKFLDGSLKFLAYCRADLVPLSEATCSESVDAIEGFVKLKSEQAVLFRYLQDSRGYWTYPTKPETSTTNWRDVAYAKLQTKADKFRVLVRDIYENNEVTWLKESESVSLLEELGKCISIASLGLYDMPRSRMSLFVSEDDYFKHVEGFVLGLCNCKHIIGELQAGDKKPNWEPFQLIPKRGKLSPLVYY